MALQNYSIQSMKTYLGNQYSIPNYQREYSWEGDELTDFWNDLCSTVKENQIHFFGQIVVHNNQNTKKYIIDGQQRTITAMVFMRTLQLMYADLFKESGNTCNSANKKSVLITSSFIGDIEEGKQYHLTLGELDNDFFVNNILQSNPVEKKEKRKAFDRLRKAYSFFNKQLTIETEKYDAVDEKVKCLDQYYDAFTELFQILYMEATELEEAFIIFETLNARGRELETADLLKNYIFSKSNDIQSAQKQWTSMINKLDGADPTMYIRHFWNASHDFTRDKALYRVISHNVSSPRDSNELMKSLEAFSDAYHDMRMPEENSRFVDAALLASLRSLSILNAKTFYPLILAMLEAETTYDEADLKKVASAVETLVFRNFTVCGKNANEGETYFASLARNVYGSIITSSDEIVGQIQQKTVSDEEFKEAFTNWVTPKRKDLVRYVLTKVHRYLDKTMELNLDNSEVHIEHIMPENISKWQGITEEDHQEYLWRIGNLALMDGKLNVKMSNNPFDVKKASYAQSKIEPNPSLCNYDDWNTVSIENRQRELADYAVEIWSK